jgi:hypothetical protein
MAFYQTSTPDTVYIPSGHHVVNTPDILKIREWLPWSIVNIFIGWGLGGVIPLVFTMLCRTKKRNNNFNEARTMSTLALVFNIIVTISGIAGWIALIILLVNARRVLNLYNSG